MEINIIEEIRKFVECECSKHELGKEILVNHFVPVVNHSKILAEKKKANLEIVEIAAWLHDIGSIVNGREGHHITGVKIAEEKLKELNYPEEKIELVKKCILNHRGSINNERESIEEQIVAEADCMNFFDNLDGYFLWVIDGDNIKNQKLVRVSVRQKAHNKYNQLSEEGKELVKEKYEAVMLLFGENAN